VTTDAESILECSAQIERATGDWQGCAESQVYLSKKVAAQEKEIIESALREWQGRVLGPSGDAAKLGFARSTLESKLKSLKIDKERFKTLPEI